MGVLHVAHVHRLGYRFRLHRKELPGCPDLVLPRLRMVILVQGCFWHRHPCRWGRVVPKTNAAFWQRKLAGNVARDRRNVRALRRLGWKVLVIWECQCREAVRSVQPVAGRNDAARKRGRTKPAQRLMLADRVARFLANSDSAPPAEAGG